MVEWHTTPDYIINNWTHELLDLMVRKLGERKERELAAIQGRSSTMSAEQLAARSRGMIEVVKSAN